MKNADQPIVPSMYTQTGNDTFRPLKDGQKTGYEVKFGGLTKRELFAAMAMQGLLANHHIIEAVNLVEIGYIQSRSVALADALLSELDKTETT